MRMNKKKILKKIIGSAIVLIIIIILLYLVFKSLGLTNISQEELQEFISSTGVVAPLIYILLTFLQVILIPIPTTVTIFMGSYLFGPFFAFIYSYIGLLLGSLAAYFLGKLLGRPFVNWLSGGKEQTDKWMAKLNGRENILLFFMFLFPLFPDDVLCAIAGILPISTKGFIIMQLITRFTTTICTLLFMTGEIIPFNGWGIPVILSGFLLCILAFIYCFKNAEKINVALRKLYKNIFDKKNKDNVKEDEKYINN